MDTQPANTSTFHYNKYPKTKVPPTHTSSAPSAPSSAVTSLTNSPLALQVRRNVASRAGDVAQYVSSLSDQLSSKGMKKGNFWNFKNLFKLNLSFDDDRF